MTFSRRRGCSDAHEHWLEPDWNWWSWDAALQTARDGIALLWLSTCPRETNLPTNYLELEVLEGIPTFNGMTRCLDHKVYILERKITRNYQTLIGHCGWPGCFLHLNHSVQGYLVLGRMVEDHTESNLSLRSWNPSSRKPCPSRWIRSASRTRAQSLHNTGLPGRYVPFIHPSPIFHNHVSGVGSCVSQTILRPDSWYFFWKLFSLTWDL